MTQAPRIGASGARIIDEARTDRLPIKQQLRGRARRSSGKPRIVLAVTISASIGLYRGYQTRLAQDGWDVHVVSSPGPEMDDLIASGDGVTYHALPMERNPSPRSDLKGLGQWLRLLRQLRPDVVSAGTPKAGLLATTAAAMLRLPVRIYHQRGLRLETETGARRRVLWAAERCTVVCATHVLAVSHSLKSTLVRERLAPASKVTVLGAGSSAGVDMERFSGVPGPRTDGRRVIGYVGRLTIDKGLGTLAAAVELLHHRSVSPELLVVGGVEEDAALVPLQRLRDLGVPVTCTGFVAEPAPFYGQMAVHCLPTKKEGFPNVVLEASACAVPTVTTTATGAVDSVVDGQTGYLVPIDDAEAMADALMTLLQDPELGATMGRAAKDRVRQHFDRRVVWPLMDEFHLGAAGLRR